MFKMVLHDSFDHLKHKLWPKERLGVKLPIWLPTIKSWESTLFPYVKVAWHIPLETSWQGLQLSFKPHLNRRSAHKVMGLQSHESPNFKILGFQLRSPWTKWHLGVSPMARHKEYYKGAKWWFPPSLDYGESWESMYALVRLAPKMFQLCTNQLVVWFVQVCVNNWFACHSS
jgi:hypothetical protein